jgi:hypothetical protein
MCGYFAARSVLARAFGRRGKEIEDAAVGRQFVNVPLRTHLAPRRREP